MSNESNSPPHAEHVRASKRPDGLWEVEVRANGERLGDVSRVVYATATGSYLYGTAREGSDRDLKGVYLADLDDIILGRDRARVRFETDEPSGDGADELDAEFLELRTMISALLEGHPYALEMLHAPEESRLLTSRIWRAIDDRRERLVSARLEPFVGYCRAQARRYGEKARRRARIEAILEVLEEVPGNQRLRSVIDELPLEGDYTEIVEQPIRGQERPVELLRVCDKKYEFDAPVSKAVESLRSLESEYGDRVRDRRGEKDWKAVAHAYRIAHELRELRESGRLEFPRREAEFLRSIRRGEIDPDRVERELPELVRQAIETPTDLPDEPDEEFWADWVVDLYLARAGVRGRTGG